MTTNLLIVSLVLLGMLVLLGLCYKLLLRLLGIVIVPNNGVGIVTKKFNLGGANARLPDGKIVALNGEAGIQADTLAPGLHYWLWPWQYSVNVVPFVTVEEGKIGIVESRDGVPLSGGRVLASRVESDSFQNARAFLTNGGQRGPQIAVIPPGTYRINTALFTVTDTEVLEIEENRVGVVTTKEGRGLPAGEIAGLKVDGHSSFQDGEAFLAAGGYKGLQEQVLLAGRYFINPMFATVETVAMTEVPIAHAGVVIAYVGETGKDVTGENFRHGNLVEKGKKGVWAEPLDPGRYAINPRTHRVENVPTANVVLNWATGKSEAHKLDEKLSTITVRSSDGALFGVDNATNCDSAEEFNRLLPGRHYGHPFRMASDRSRSDMGLFDCEEPDPADGTTYTAAWGNLGPDARPAPGEPGYLDGGTYYGFTPHSAPTGLDFYEPAAMDPQAIRFPAFPVGSVIEAAPAPRPGIVPEIL